MDTLATLGQAREQFLSLVESVRPELHRYCARLTGSVIEGEDVVQDTLAKALYALSLQPSVPNLRPWLFRIAHNTAVDFLKSHGRRLTDPTEDMDALETDEFDADPLVVRTALAHFLALPLQQRSAVILKDVLGHSLAETAETMGTTVMGVKAALVRGRTALRQATRDSDVPSAPPAELERYAALFNARDWDGLRSTLGEDCKLDLVSKSRRRGKEVGMYFGRYEKLDVTLRPVWLDGAWMLGAHEGGAPEVSYFVRLEFADGKVETIRDFRYVPYIASDV